ncbi:glycosyl hydrolase family 28-related protein [Dyella acidiphila]|uniref:Right-handed parallel beta-helix repeat-containing protein n=1 Tax=Dyella acidiphila TaxID=2775866 RepID=A0ABR9GE05_9GAMM|nr:glycosyl hydrolase family 28-related protein [Dyella acidiphila]MBE1162289.1 right-handed parallel beta-helix repeat-containing protein [Dyella acidiphila]
MPASPHTVNVLNFLPEAERASIRAGTSTYDCTSGIQAAIDSGDKVLIPAGIYHVRQLNLKSNLELYGEGPTSELIAYDSSVACEFMLVTYVRDGGTPNVDDNMRNILVHDLKLNGRVSEFTYSQYFYLFAVNATSDLTVERVVFYGFRGDGMYVGSGTLKTTERHNQRVIVRDCLFDGAVKDNRNGLSIIDCDQLTVTGCTFTNIGNSKLSHSVGAIDFEPDHNWSIYRNVLISQCKFTDIDTVNTAGITFFNGHQSGENIHDWKVTNCQFTNCYWGICCATKPKTAEDVPDNLSVLNCQFLNSVRFDITLGGLSYTQISKCTFERSPPGSGPGGDSIRLGSNTWRTNKNAINTVITGNTFNGIRPQMGAIGVYGAKGLVCAGNTFIDIYGPCVSFAEDESDDAGRYIGDVIISGNKVRRAGTLSSGRAIPMSFLGTNNQLRVVKGNMSLQGSFNYDNDIQQGIVEIEDAADIQFMGTR